MIRVGLVGIGFMGWIHYLAYQRVPGVRVAAIVSRDAGKRRGDWRGIRGNFGPPGRQVDLEGVAAYEHLDALLADATIDVVDICLPPHLHPEAVRRSLAAGKHVLCEKPLALDAATCDQLVLEAQRAGRQLLVGHVLPFFPEYAAARRLVWSGRLGKPLGGTFRRVISDPQWLADYYHPQRIGGPLLDLHVHDAHWLRLVLGMPQSITSAGRRRNGVVEYCHTLWRFPDSQRIACTTAGVIHQQGRPFMHGFEMHFERGTLEFEFAALATGPQTSPAKLLTEDGEVQPLELDSTDPVDAFVAELSEVQRCISTGRASELLDGQLARDAVRLCQAQAESVASGRPAILSPPNRLNLPPLNTDE